jgi:hypothetical protein
VGDGQNCACTSDCATAAVGTLCFTEGVTGWAQGFCGHQCSSDRECGTGTICAGRICQAVCRVPDDCGTGRICDFRSADDQLSCASLCDEDTDCLSGHCNVYSGRCTASIPALTGAGAAGACATNTDCRSDSCVMGACLSRCDSRFQRCPDATRCVALEGNSGLCLPACASDADCAPYGVKRCVALPDGKFCSWE